MIYFIIIEFKNIWGEYEKNFFISLPVKYETPVSINQFIQNQNQRV